jgi:hypothetical protein
MSTAADSFRVGVMIAINTPYFLGSICAIILNLVIPTDLIDEAELEIEETWHKEEEEALNKSDDDDLDLKEDVEAAATKNEDPQKTLAEVEDVED